MTGPHEQVSQNPEFASEAQANQLRETIERVTFNEGYAEFAAPRQGSGQVHKGDRLLPVYDEEPQYTHPPLAGSVIRSMAPEAAGVLNIGDTDSVQLTYTPECFTKTSASEETVYAHPTGMVSIERPEAETSNFFEVFNVGYSKQTRGYEVTHGSDDLETFEGLMDLDSEALSFTNHDILTALAHHDETMASQPQDTQEVAGDSGAGDDDLGAKRSVVKKAIESPRAPYQKVEALQQVLDALYPEPSATQQ